MSYKRSKYFITLSKRKIKYLYIKKNSQITVVFFHGFMSDMIGAKPMAIQKFCRKKKLNFLKFEYSGHGKSTGKFIEGNISKWTGEGKQLIKSKIKTDNNLLLLKTEMNAGHGGKTGRDSAIEEIALDYTFALKISNKLNT